MKSLFFLTATLSTLLILSCTKDRTFPSPEPVVVPIDTTGSHGKPVFGSIKINEFMATESHTPSLNEYDSASDWIELYNATEKDIDLGENWYISDAISKQEQFKLPAVTIAAHKFLVIWCDSKGTVTGNPDVNKRIHSNFNLSSKGEQIALSYSDNGNMKYIDSLSFGAQQKDISYGRKPDGSTGWQSFSTPTPGSSNN